MGPSTSNGADATANNNPPAAPFPKHIDLRRYNITDQDSMMEFLELIVAKVPQMIRYMKKTQLETQSLRNHNANLKQINDELNNVTPPPPVGDNVSVSDRLAGKTFAAPQLSEADRLAQLRAAGTPATDEPQEVVTNPSLLPNPTQLPEPPKAPGEIGSLNLAPMNTRPPVDPAPPAPLDNPEALAPVVDPNLVGPNVDGQAITEDFSEDDIDLDGLGGSEPTAPPVIPPSKEDITPVATKVSQAQLSDKPLKNQNRPELNATAKAAGIENPEAMENNRQVREAIEAARGAGN